MFIINKALEIGIKEMKKNKVMSEKTFPEWEKNINNILDNIDKIANNEYFKREEIKVEYKNKKDE